jgi:hypothetical protein
MSYEDRFKPRTSTKMTYSEYMDYLNTLPPPPHFSMPKVTMNPEDVEAPQITKKPKMDQKQIKNIGSSTAEKNRVFEEHNYNMI